MSEIVRDLRDEKFLSEMTLGKAVSEQYFSGLGAGIIKNHYYKTDQNETAVGTSPLR